MSSTTKTSSFLIAAFTVLFYTCSSIQKATKDEAQTYSTDFEYEQDRVLILLVDLQPGGARIRNSKLISGNFKPMVDPVLQRETVRVQYLDQLDHVLYEKILEHPLFQYKEYVDEDGTLKYVRVEESNGTLMLRSQYSSNFKSIRIDYGFENRYKTISQLPILVDD
ncbi:MAG: hypothetical protein HKN76_02195 [Saprospiraceae bacterium]|nr:hypothetical protein [Saprospiraceae bacterium]